jgi:hypothetical protein
MANPSGDDPDRCAIIFSGRPVSWTCLEEMKHARRHLGHYIAPSGTEVGRHLCETCLRKLHAAGLSVPVTVTGPNAVPEERIPS